MSRFAEYTRHDGLGLAELIAKKEVSASEVLEACRERLERVNPRINAVVSILEEAFSPGQARAGEEGAPFRGVPFLLKDLGALMQGTVTTFGSKLFADARADHDSELVARYRRAGLVVVGKTNTSEMGLVVTTEPALFGPTRNPWDITRSAGGSSGGSAAAVAAGIVPWAHATDGGGSIRIPASCCGLFGLKPTRARTPLAPDAGERNGGFFTQHAITRTVRDSAALLDAAAGAARGDPYCAPPLGRPLLHEVGAPVGRLRIAVQRDAGDGAMVSEECREAVDAAARLCEALGHVVVDVTPGYSIGALIDAAMVIWSSSLASALESYCDARGRSIPPNALEPFTWYFSEIGRRCQAAEYVRAIHTVHALGRAIAELLTPYDVLLAPSLASEPVPLGALTSATVGSVEDAREFFVREFHYSPFTMIANASGNPAMSVPLAWTKSGLPIGTQFLGRFGDEPTLFRLAAQLEEARPWFDRRPPLADQTRRA
jgi:Asp-tRNA(Asn)/Glu-tRNA(Gln) amidotransferase A subunit family amidase